MSGSGSQADASCGSARAGDGFASQGACVSISSMLGSSSGIGQREPARGVVGAGPGRRRRRRRRRSPDGAAWAFADAGRPCDRALRPRGASSTSGSGSHDRGVVRLGARRARPHRAPQVRTARPVHATPVDVDVATARRAAATVARRAGVGILGVLLRLLGIDDRVLHRFRPVRGSCSASRTASQGSAPVGPASRPGAGSRERHRHPEPGRGRHRRLRGHHGRIAAHGRGQGRAHGTRRTPARSPRPGGARARGRASRSPRAVGRPGRSGPPRGRRRRS